jgi:hypothetical protein
MGKKEYYTLEIANDSEPNQKLEQHECLEAAFDIEYPISLIEWGDQMVFDLGANHSDLPDKM